MPNFHNFAAEHLHAIARSLYLAAGAPRHIADAVAAICGHDMRYVTGQTIHATGGFYMG